MKKKGWKKEIKIDMPEEQFFHIPVNIIKQFQSGYVLSGKMKFIELLKICKFTQRIESKELGIVEKKYSTEEEKYYQRNLSPTRLNKIANFLEEEYKKHKRYSNDTSTPVALGMFPTSLLLAVDLREDPRAEGYNPDSLLKEDNKDDISCILDLDKKILHITIPPLGSGGFAFIVDGQHRFAGIKILYERMEDNEIKRDIENFEFITTFLIGFDLYQQGKIFATVNFTQKPVNRSIYYDIFGSLPDTFDEITLAHQLTLYMNNGDTPLKDMIKLLGRGRGLISQAFFVETVLPYLKEGGVWENIFKDFQRGGKKYEILPLFMTAYFEVIKKSFNKYWPTVYSPWHYKKPLCKTNGMGALLRLIRDIYPKIHSKDKEGMKKEIDSFFIKIEEKVAEELFSEQSEFAKSGSVGLQIKLYRVLRDCIGL